MSDVGREGSTITYLKVVLVYSDIVLIFLSDMPAVSIVLRGCAINLLSSSTLILYVLSFYYFLLYEKLPVRGRTSEISYMT
jgi:hypothetical protein